MAAYYNEIEPYAAQWLRNLIAAGHIAPGDVDERDIRDVRPDDLRGYTQCHFFAGIGVWSYALRLAGWSDDRPVWTGSCPCQPFSQAGQGAGFDDERHVWPAWDHLIRERRPAAILGEQVASKDAEPWLDLVSADLEGLGYAFGALAFPSAGVGAPHIRDRTYFVAHASSQRCNRQRLRLQPRQPRQDNAETGRRSKACFVADTNGRKRNGIAVVRGAERDREDSRRPQGCGEPESCGDVCELADAYSERSLPGALTGVHSREESTGPRHGKSERLGSTVELADTSGTGRRERSTDALRSEERSSSEGLEQRSGDLRFLGRSEAAGPTNGFWRDADWLLCRDEKWRPVEPGTFPLADGAPSRVVRVCPACLQKGSIDENVRKLLKDADRHERRRTAEVLLQGMHGSSDGGSTHDAGEWTLSSATHVLGNAVQSMPVQSAAGTAPSGREPDEQRAGKHRDSLRQVSSPASRTTSADIGLRGLRSNIHGEVPPEQSQSVLCDVCGRVGSDLRQSTLVGNRTGKLRAYGNAINAYQAAEFIAAARETIDSGR